MYKMSDPTMEDMTTPANRSTRNVSSDIATRMKRRMYRVETFMMNFKNREKRPIAMVAIENHH
jgi:hypothetical protein